MSVADVAAKLKMRVMYVDALERDNWELVGEPVYARGFLRSYARLVGLDASPLVEALNRDYRADANVPAFSEAPPPPADYSYSQHARSERSSSFYPWLLGAMTTIAIVLVIWVVRVYFFTPETVVQQPAAMSASATPLQTQTTPAQNAAVASTSLNADNTVRAGVDLRLQLTQASWLAITVDGHRVLYETLPAGTVREFRGAREITLRAGNAGGVIATVDGQPLGTLGSRGQVQDRVFAAKAPSFPATGPRE